MLSNTLAFETVGDGAMEAVAHKGKRTIYVIDAQAGVGENIMPKFDSDAQWFANTLSSMLSPGLEDLSLPIEEVVAAAVSAAKSKYDAVLGSTEMPSWIYPSANIVIARVEGDVFKLFSMGNCVTILKMEDDEIRIVRRKDINTYIKPVIEFVEQQSLRMDCTFKNALKFGKEPLADVIKTRRNVAGGYWCLDAANTFQGEQVVSEFPLKAVKEVAIMTDSYYAVSSRYKAVERLVLLQRMKDQGLEKVYNELEQVRNSDLAMKRFPRLAVVENAAAVLSEIQH